MNRTPPRWKGWPRDESFVAVCRVASRKLVQSPGAERFGDTRLNVGAIGRKDKDLHFGYASRHVRVCEWTQLCREHCR